MTDLQKLLDEVTTWPWVYREQSIHGRKYGGGWVEGPEMTDDDGKPCATLIQISGSGGSRSYTTRVVDIQDHNDNDANARLIALAPQLAAALIKAREGLREIESGDCVTDWSDNPHQDMQSRARAALAEIDALMGGNDGH